MRSSQRRKDERGFALIVALVLAILYLGFIELLLMDASREMSEARRFRARIVALTLAENGAELAATRMVSMVGGTGAPPVSEEGDQGTVTGSVTVNGAGDFDLLGGGQSKGREATTAQVRLEGRIVGNQVTIYFSRHTQ